MNSLVIALNTIKRLIREPYSFAVLVALPIIAGVMTVYFFGEASMMKVGIANLPESGKTLIESIDSTHKFKVRIMDEAQVEKAVKDKKIKIGLVFPENAEKIKNGGKAKVYALINDPNILTLGSIVDSYVSTAVRSGNKQQINSKVLDTIKDTPQMATGVGFMLMSIIMFAGTGVGILLEDKRNKTFMRVFCTPLREYEAVLGSFLANILLGTIQIVLFLTISVYILGIDFEIPTANLFAILMVFMLTAIGLNIGIAGFVRNNHVFTVINVMYASCTGMISGSFFPLSMLNKTMRNIANFFPQKWAMEAYEKMAGGSTFNEIGIQLLVLLLFGAVFFTFGAKVLKPAGEDL